MRYSYYRQLINEEHRQRGPCCGRHARTRQLTVLTALLLGLYIVCTYNIWRHPRPIHHVWIDDVLVDVIEENWIDYARGGLLYAGLCCAALLGVTHLFLGMTTSSASPASTTEGIGSLQYKSRGMRSAPTAPQKTVSTIAVPAWARCRAREKQQPQASLLHNPVAEFMSRKDGLPSSTTTSAAAAVIDRARAFDARRPMRSDKDLNVFLAYEAAQTQQQQQQFLSAGDNIGLRYRGTIDDNNLYQSDVDVIGSDALSVTYEGRGALNSMSSRTGVGLEVPLSSTSPYASGGGAALAPSTLPWGELGIFYLEEALQRTREWLCDVCRKLIDDVDECDRWFSEHQMEAYDCHHSLQELLPTPTTNTTQPQTQLKSGGGLWGASSTTATATSGGVPAATPQLEPKLAALLREKAYCRQAQQGMQELDTALRYDQRLALEARLDVTGTFPSSSLTRPSNAELTATREYTVDRLRTFAKQRFLVSYNASGGDAETWHSGYPCDGHLLLHVLRLSVKGLSEYVRFGYQTGTQTQDLALYVGDTGEPYFYVRFRQGSRDALLSTRQGPTSLMEAVLAFAAVIHTYYHDVFGGIRGTVDLAEAGLLKVVTESRRSTWGRGG